MTRRTRFCGLLLAGLLLNATGCIVYPVRVEVEDRQSAAFDGVQRVAVETRNGAIEVRCDPTAKQVDVHTIRTARGITEEDARKFIEKIEIQVARDQARADTLRIEAHMPVNEWSRNQGARFEITMPPTAELLLDTSNGRIVSEGCARDVHATTSNGRINVRDCKGALVARTSNGEVSASDVAGNVDVVSSNGHIELQRVGRDNVKAVTSNGRIRIVDASGAANLRSSNGSVELHCREVPPRPDIQVVTSNGHVEVELPATVNATVSLDTSNGRVLTDLRGVQIDDLETHRSFFKARLNDGGGQIDLHSSNGSVTLRTTGAPNAGIKPAADRS